jgi:hypothetical protein
VVGIVEVVEEEDGPEGPAGADGPGALSALQAQRRRAELAGAALEVVALYASPTGSGLKGAAGMRAGSRSGGGGGGGGDGEDGSSRGGGGGGGGAAASTDEAQSAASAALRELMESTQEASLQLPAPWADGAAARAAHELLGVMEGVLRLGPGLGALAGGEGAAKLPAAVQQLLLPRLRDDLFAPHRHAQAQERGCSGGCCEGRGHG